MSIDLSNWALRFIQAFSSGGLLALLGSLLQLSSRNVLVTPSTLGIEGVAVVFYLFVIVCSHLFSFEIPQFSFLVLGVAFSFLPCWWQLTFLRAEQTRGRVLWPRLILMGVALNIVAGALFSLIRFLLMSTGRTLPSQFFYGSFKWPWEGGVWGSVFVFCLAYGLWIRQSRSVEILTWSKDYARQLGIDERSVITALLLWGWPLSFFLIGLHGPFYFVGLLFPLLWRQLPWFQGHRRAEIIGVPLFSGLLLACLDSLCYWFPFYGSEIPVGLLSAVVGPVALFALLLRKKN